MKVTAKKSSKSTSTAARQSEPGPFFAKAANGGNFFAPATRTAVPGVQLQLAVGKAGDKFEQEADKMAGRVMRLPAPATTEPEERLPGPAGEKLQKAALPEKEERDKIQKAPAVEERLQRRGSGAMSAVDGTVQASIRSKMTGGQPLASETRSYMEPRFQADFSNVRTHSDAESASLSNRLGARAFTYQNHIFFSRDQYQPGSSEGKHLLAHELTHTIQQGHAVQRSPRLNTLATQPHIQRSVVGEILDWIADKAKYIPGFRMFTIILGVNPINMTAVDRSAANILRALIELMPGGAFITTALDNHGVFTKVAAWMEKQVKALGMVGSMFKKALMDFLDSLGWRDLAPWKWGGVWDRAKRIFTAPIERLIAFAKGVVTDIIKFIKDAILKPLAALAQGTRGYDLLKAILGQDPITGEPVPRNADTLIGGFMKLIGQEEIWANLKKGKAVARAWAWFQGALAGLLGFVRTIPRRIIDTLKSLTIKDIVTVAGAFAKIVGAFLHIAGDFISWGLKQVIGLLEILFSVVAPGVMPYIQKAKGAFATILKNPVGFIRNLVRAGKLGFQMFAGNILEHLKTALIKWIVGPLAEAGVYIPKSFELKEIVKLVLSVLGLTWEAIRSKLVKIIPDPILAGLEKTAGILVTLVKEGPAAAWEQIKAELSELKDQLIGQIIQMVSVEVVKAAVIKIVSMLNPVGAVIQAILAIYDTIMFFVEKIKQIGAVVAAFIDSIAAIASGIVVPAAKKVEQTMANALVVVIAFLAKFARLGGIPDKVVGIIKKIRAPIDKAMDKIVGWLGKMLKKMVGGVKAGVGALVQWWKKKVPVVGGGETHSLEFEGVQDNPRLIVRSTPQTPAEFVLDLTPDSAIKSKVAKITNSINSIKQKVAAAQKKSPPDEATIAAGDKQLSEKFNELGQVLADSLNKSGDEGSIKRPLPIDYPKRRAAAYPNIYTGPLTNLYLDQKWLKQAAAASGSKAKAILTAKESKLTSEQGFMAWDGKVTVYRAAGGASQAIQGGAVGLDPAFANLAPGKVLVYSEKFGTGGGGKINKMFRPYGFRPSKEGLDGDHVMERQLGGPDAINNLWPLESSENRSSGSTVKSLKVKFRNKDKTVHEVRLMKPDKILHLLIRSVKTG